MKHHKRGAPGFDPNMRDSAGRRHFKTNSQTKAGRQRTKQSSNPNKKAECGDQGYQSQAGGPRCLLGVPHGFSLWASVQKIHCWTTADRSNIWTCERDFFWTWDTGRTFRRLLRETLGRLWTCQWLMRRRRRDWSLSRCDFSEQRWWMFFTLHTLTSDFISKLSLSCWLSVCTWNQSSCGLNNHLPDWQVMDRSALMWFHHHTLFHLFTLTQTLWIQCEALDRKFNLDRILKTLCRFCSLFQMMSAAVLFKCCYIQLKDV